MRSEADDFIPTWIRCSLDLLNRGLLATRGESRKRYHPQLRLSRTVFSDIAPTHPVPSRDGFCRSLARFNRPTSCVVRITQPIQQKSQYRVFTLCCSTRRRAGVVPPCHGERNGRLGWYFRTPARFAMRIRGTKIRFTYFGVLRTVYRCMVVITLLAWERARTGVLLTVTIDEYPTMAGFVAGDRGSMDVDDQFCRADSK